MGFVPKVNVPPHPTKPAWTVPMDALVDFTHVDKVPFYPKCKQLLESEFHHTKFLPRQLACINSAIRGYDLLIALPTSAGKSLCYQLPAIFSASAITLIVSPTKTLIEDQIRALHALGPQWKTLAQRSHSDHPNRLHLFTDQRGNAYPRLFYICPEWIDNPSNQRTLYSLCGSNSIARIVIDEAHNAIRGLANEHRVAYRSIFSLRQYFPTIPFTLVSASLTYAHQVTLTTALHSRGRFYSVSAPSERKNFIYRVVHIPSKDEGKGRDTYGIAGRYSQRTLKIAVIATYLSTHPKARGFVFVPTRKLAQVRLYLPGNCQRPLSLKLVKAVAEKLEVAGVEGVEWYHAGKRTRLPDVMARFNAGLISVLVCTSAFGEGVDNKLVDFVFHYSIPQSMTAYFQQTGRVGTSYACIDWLAMVVNAHIVTVNWGGIRSRWPTSRVYTADIISVVNVVANDVPPTNSHYDLKERAFLPTQQAELQEVLEFWADSFSCRHKKMMEFFGIPVPATAKLAQASASERFASLYTRAMHHAYHMDLGDSGASNNGVATKDGVDENCGGCDVCYRRYRAPDSQPEVQAEEPDNFQLITNEEIMTVENAFQNDTTMLFSTLVKHISAPKNSTMKVSRAKEVVEFLAVSGVLKMTFEYARKGKGAGFSIKLEKGSNQIDSIHRPLPIPYTALGPLKLPTQSRKAANPRPKKGKRRQRASMESSFMDLTEDAVDPTAAKKAFVDLTGDTDGEGNPNVISSDTEDSGETDSDSDAAGIEFEDDVSILTIGDDEDDIRAIQLDGTEEDGYGMNIVPMFRSSRKRRRSTSFELPSPPASGGPSTRNIEEPDSEPCASPPKRRRMETARRNDSVERPLTDSARMLEKFNMAVGRKRGKDSADLLSVSKRTLRKLFARHASIADEDGFRLALKEVKASTKDTTILLDWYEWIENEVFASRFIVGARRD